MEINTPKIMSDKTPPRAPTREELSIALRAAYEALFTLQQNIQAIIGEEMAEEEQQFEKEMAEKLKTSV